MPNPFNSPSVSSSGIQSVSAGFKKKTLPHTLNIQHWYDVTDEATVWADAGGTIPITPGGNPARIDDKGYAGDHLTDDSFQVSPLVWNPNQINGLAAVDTDADPNLTALYAAVTVPGGAEGVTWAGVGYRSGAPNSSGLIGFANDAIPQLLVDDSGNLFGMAPNWGYININALIQADSGIPVVDFQWSYGIFTHAANGDYTVEFNGYPAITGNFPYIPVTVGTGRVGLGGLAVGKQTEGMIWDIALGYNGRAQLRNYFNKKYGGLPRV
jgi:hypothetical protein